jgi:hypothetical protein
MDLPLPGRGPVVVVEVVVDEVVGWVVDDVVEVVVDEVVGWVVDDVVEEEEDGAYAIK